MSEMKAPLQIFLSFNIITVLAAIIEEQEPASVLLETEEAFPSLNLELIMSSTSQVPISGSRRGHNCIQRLPRFYASSLPVASLPSLSNTMENPWLSTKWINFSSPNKRSQVYIVAPLPYSNFSFHCFFNIQSSNMSHSSKTLRLQSWIHDDSAMFMLSSRNSKQTYVTTSSEPRLQKPLQLHQAQAHVELLTFDKQSSYVPRHPRNKGPLRNHVDASSVAIWPGVTGKVIDAQYLILTPPTSSCRSRLLRLQLLVELCYSTPPIYLRHHALRTWVSCSKLGHNLVAQRALCPCWVVRAPCALCPNLGFGVGEGSQGLQRNQNRDLGLAKIS